MRAYAQAEETAYTHLTFDGADPVQISYGDLYHRAGAVASKLSSLGLRHQPVLLVFHAGPDFAPALYGALLAGAVAVPAPAPRFESQYTRLDRIAADCRPGAILGTEAVFDLLRRRLPEDSFLRACPWLTPDMEEAAPFRVTCSAEDVALLQYTSGSTDVPRGVAVTHGNLADNMDMIARAFEAPEGMRTVSWLPHFHDMGLLAGFLAPMLFGGQSILMSPLSFLQRPLRWLEAISQHRAMLSGAPNFAYDLCVRWADRGNVPELDLSCWQTAFAGAEPIRRSTLEAFADRFRASGFRRTALTPCYGMAEATLMVTCKQAGAEPTFHSVSRAALEAGHAIPTEGQTALHLTGCGRPAIRTDVRIVDPQTFEDLGRRRVGEIWVRGPQVSAGYHPPCADDPFGATLAYSGEGPFLRTGDLGFIADDGDLVFVDRIKNLLVINGQNYVCYDLESAAAASHELLTADAIAATALETDNGPHLLLIAEFPANALDYMEQSAQAIRGALFTGHGLAVRTVALVPPGKLNRTTSGKLQRRLSAKNLVAGCMRVLAVSGDPIPRPCSLLGGTQTE
jgi:acyl-CoA synthetase (AMP-forming)/AMP-acid ligase II